MHASVYKCFLISDPFHLSPFAVKTLKEDDEEKLRAHFNEFEIAKELNHPNVVKALEMFENKQKKEIHIVMDFVDG